MTDSYNTRAARALEFRRAGHSYKTIGKILGRADDANIPVGQARAAQLVARGLWREHRNDPEYVSSDERARQLTKELRSSGKLNSPSERY